VPFAGALLADMGADVVRIDRLPAKARSRSCLRAFDFYNRNRALARARSEASGVREDRAEDGPLVPTCCSRLSPWSHRAAGVRPEPCLQANPRLVYARMTGWGQEGPLAQVVGHDINYLALTGALHCIGSPGQPRRR